MVSDRRVARGYHEKELQIQACDWPQTDDKEIETGLGTLRDWELKQEGEDGQEFCVDVVERELHKHSTSPGNTRTDRQPRYFRVTSCFGTEF